MTDPDHKNQNLKTKSRKLSYGNKLSLKFLLICLLALLLLIPSLFVLGIVKERERYKNQAITDIENSWSSSQIVAGPILNIAYRRKKGSVYYKSFFPEQLNIKSNLAPRTKTRGIFKTVVYLSENKVSGKFPKLLKESGSQPNTSIIWNKSYIVLGLNELKGIEEARIKLDQNKTYRFEPDGQGGTDYLLSNRKGFKRPEIYQSIKVNLDQNTQKALAKNKELSFELDLNLRGAKEIRFVPIGKDTSVEIKSSWKDPSFIGNFLPSKKSISKEGFQANWKVNYLAKNYNQVHTQDKNISSLLADSSFGVSLLVAVDFYRNVLRAVKYAILVISLVFLVYFISEIVGKKRFHPFQYFLIGLALILFYLLLLSISEFLGFNWAYLISSLLTIGLISFYTYSTLKDLKNSLFVSGLLSLVYLFLYFLLQSQDLSLLLGSFLLFLFLGILMFVTRKINWYQEQMDSSKSDSL